MSGQCNFRGAFIAGLVGTIVMTLVMYGLPLVGIPRMDIMAALGSVLPLKISPYVPGAIIHFAIGVALALIYAAFFSTWLPGPGWLRGAIFSLLPWLFAITLLGPSLGLAARMLGSAPPTANPCAPALPINPCAPQAANPCAVPANPCTPVNPCAGKVANPCAAPNPCALTTAPNPCAVPLNPCAAAPVNPCAPQAANPCAAGPGSQATIPVQVLSLIVHLIYGGVVGLMYRPKGTI